MKPQFLVFLRMVLAPLCITICMSCCAAEPTSFRLMSFNIWVGGVKAGQPLSQTAKIVKLADIIGIQESHDESKVDRSVEITEQLGWNRLPQGGGRTVISRFPITGNTPNRFGAFIELPNKQTICLFNIHLPASPYQPYQLLAIEYGDAPFIKTEREAIDWAKQSRGNELSAMLVELSAVRDRGIPTFVTGDFNEPSFLDWTEQAATSGVHPIKVRYPTARLVAAHGLIDTYRQQFPDILAKPGFTWTPLTKSTDKADHHDRIDFVFADNLACTIQDCQVIGERDDAADVVVQPWPSDHRAVMTTIQMKGKPQEN